jgi:asparagine synthase (glutamine-hydrolysing)
VPETFSIAWDDPQMSERLYQEAVAAKAGVRSHTLELTPRDVWAAVDQVVLAQGQPLLGQELIAQHHAYRLAHEHGAVVVLDGSGSDEVQAGLPPYEAEMVVERLAKLQLRDVAKELHCIARNYGRSHATVFRQYLIGPLRRHLRERRGLPHYDWLDERACDTRDPQWARAYTNDRGLDPSRVNRLLYRETKHTNIPAVLMYSDRNAMAHSVEARFPFLDHRLVEFCFSLPASYKVGFGRRKRLLWETSKEYLPRLIMERKDKKYFVLLSNWMPLREHGKMIRDASRNAAFRNLPWVNVPRMHRFVDDYLAQKHDNAYAVWRIYTASRWFELHGL